MMTEPGKVLRFKFLFLLLVSSTVVVVDQWSKYLVHSRFRWGESLSIIQNLFALTYVRNSGAAFGLLHRAPSWFRDPFFIVVPVVALFVILFILVTLPPDQKKAVVGLSLVFGGAVGNLIDRLRFGYVIDFLDFHWKEIYHWPAFNVADSAIVVGVGLMFILSLFQGKSSLPSSSRLSHTASAGE
jgi:signal peptidase II